MNYLVSIITPVYNSEKYIKETIDSVFKQTYTNWEWIIVNDGSSDNSLNIIKLNTNNDNRVKIIDHNINKGQAHARNTALKHASGKYITFIDSDDIWNNNFLEKMTSFIQKNEVRFAFSSYIRKSEDLKTSYGKYRVPRKVSYNKLLTSNYISCLTAMYDVSAIGKHYYNTDLRIHEDYVLWLSILKHVKIAYGLNESLATYRVRQNSVSRNKRKGIIGIWNLYRNIEELSLVKSLIYIKIYIIKGINKNKKIILRDLRKLLIKC